MTIGRPSGDRTARDHGAPGTDAAGHRARGAWIQEPGRRLFVAVPLTLEACTAVAALVDRVRGAANAGAAEVHRGVDEVRWVRTDGLHLTLRFLGATAEDRVALLAAAVQEVAAAGEVLPGRDRRSRRISGS